MAKYKITHNKPICIGCGACTSVCPDFWVMEGDKSHLKGSKKEGGKEILELKDIECNQEAADVCPVQCIKIKKL